MSALAADGHNLSAQSGPDDEPDVVRAEVPADVPIYVGISADGRYRFAIATGVPTADAPVAAPRLPAIDPAAPSVTGRTEPGARHRYRRRPTGTRARWWPGRWS